MSWMNRWQIDEAVAAHANHPTLGPATATLAALRDAADRNSDGWAYWQSPKRAAAKLMDLVQAADPWRHDATEPTAAQVRAAQRAVKAFRTRSGIDFTIYEPAA